MADPLFAIADAILCAEGSLDERAKEVVSNLDAAGFAIVPKEPTASMTAASLRHRQGGAYAAQCAAREAIAAGAVKP